MKILLIFIVFFIIIFILIYAHYRYTEKYNREGSFKAFVISFFASVAASALITALVNNFILDDSFKFFKDDIEESMNIMMEATTEIESITDVKTTTETIFETETITNFEIQKKEEITEEEKENNDSVEEANNIVPNKEYKGKLFSDSDIDYYKIFIPSDGKVFIEFKHDKIDTNDRLWDITFLENNDDNSIISFYSIGNTAVQSSDRIRLKKGEYYVKINHYYFSDIDYTFSVIFEEEGDKFEKEVNNSLKEANNIFVNEYYTGNLQTEEDVDYFTFNLSQKGSISINFEHNKIDTNDRLWEICLMDDISDDKILLFNSNGQESKLTSEKVRVPAGKYYVKINKYYYSNEDYKIKINYKPENNTYESEPNNEYNIANNIYFSQKYIGNTQTDYDVDYFKFEITQTKNIDLTFEHQKIEANDIWEISVIGETSEKEILKERVSGTDSVKTIPLENLTKGIYYIKIKPYNYNNIDYSIAIK